MQLPELATKKSTAQLCDVKMKRTLERQRQCLAQRPAGRRRSGTVDNSAARDSTTVEKHEPARLSRRSPDRGEIEVGTVVYYRVRFDHPARGDGGRLNASRTRDRLTLVALGLGVTVPFIYYGIQLLCASFQPSYSFIGQAASELGADWAVRPWVFNAAFMVQGAVTLVAAVGFLAGMRRAGVREGLAVLAAGVVAVNGVHLLWAGYFPMPDRRHGGYALFIAAMTLVPIVLTAALWRGGGAGLRAYFAATLVLLAVMVPVVSGVAGFDRSSARGLKQRMYTLTVYPPIGVAAGVLIARMRRPVG
jgi:hypothetical membrane protein